MPRISKMVNLSSPMAVTIIPSLPLTVVDFPRGLKSKTYACSSYFLGECCSLYKIKTSTKIKNAP